MNALTRDDVQVVRAILQRTTGMQLADGKESFVEVRLRMVAQELGIPSVTDLLLALRSRPSAELEARVAEAMTANETLFFRDGGPFEALQRDVIPTLVERRRNERVLNLWSAACSTGQEPVSLAITVLEHFPELRGWNVRIFATDVSEKAVRRTREAKYNDLEIGRSMPGCFRDRYFHRSGPYWQANDAVRRLIDVRSMNLAKPWPPLARMDVVFLRNVLIYFELPGRRNILLRTRQQMQPDGVLFLGTAETPLAVDDAWQPAGPRGALHFVPANDRIAV